MFVVAIIMYFLTNCAFCYARNHVDEYCLNENFRPQCKQNEVILVKNATYGRMRVGRCLTAEEVETHRAAVGDNPRYFGCSVNILDILDERCSGKSDCDVRVIDIQDNNIRPCAPGLSVYLEASYDCISVVDERRSCLIKAQSAPIHIINSSPIQRICGTNSQPWIVESPIGQKISVTLIDSVSTKKDDNTNDKKCRSYGTIVDQAGSQNISICGSKDQRQRKLYLSKGNTLQVYLTTLEHTHSQENDRKFILNFEAVGCSEIVPPEDTWLKRKDDAVVIGCYSTRQTWQLSCNEGKWIGVLGNCSASKYREASAGFEDSDNKVVYMISDQEQVLAIVAISGCTFAVCLVIACVGAVCLRRFYFRYKTQHDYKTLSLRRDPNFSQNLTRGIPSVAAAETLETEERSFDSKLLPTYAVYAGDNNSLDYDKNAVNNFIANLNH